MAADVAPQYTVAPAGCCGAKTSVYNLHKNPQDHHLNSQSSEYAEFYNIQDSIVMYAVRILIGSPGIVTEVIRGIPQYLQANSGRAVLLSDRLLPNDYPMKIHDHFSAPFVQHSLCS